MDEAGDGRWGLSAIALSSVSRRGFLALLAALPACRSRTPVGHLRLAIESAPLTLDPRGAFNADTAHVQQLLFNTLVTKGSRYTLVPELAESWEISPDATRHTFRLRRDARFHDGKTLTAQDVAYTFSSMLEGNLGKSSAFEALDGVMPLDEHTVSFASNHPNPGLLVDLVAVGILPVGESKAVGTGAYRLSTPWNGEGDLELASFADYFGGAPRWPSITVRTVPDPATLASSFEADEIDLAVNPPIAPSALDRLTGVIASQGGGVQFIVLNCERPELGDSGARRALGAALDRQAMLGALLGGRGRVARSVLPDGHYAAAAIRESPFTKPEPWPVTSLELLALSRDRDLAAIVQESWSALGTEVRITTTDPAAFADRLAKGQFGAAIHRLTGGNQFTTIFKGAFHSRSIHTADGSRGELNYARFASDDMDRLIERSDETADYAELQQRLADACPWILLWHPDNVAVSRVGPVELNPGGDFYFLRA